MKKLLALCALGTFSSISFAAVPIQPETLWIQLINKTPNPLVCIAAGNEIGNWFNLPIAVPVFSPYVSESIVLGQSTSIAGIRQAKISLMCVTELQHIGPFITGIMAFTYNHGELMGQCRFNGATCSIKSVPGGAGFKYEGAKVTIVGPAIGNH